jgi:hypothetical protein
MTPQPVTGEVLAGVVERVTYHNAENGFCVLRARARGHRDVVTVVGHAAAISAGDERRFDPGLDNSCISRCASPSQADAIQALTSTSCPGHSVAAGKLRRANRGQSCAVCSCPYLFRWRSLREWWLCEAWWCSFSRKAPARTLRAVTGGSAAGPSHSRQFGLIP